MRGEYKNIKAIWIEKDLHENQLRESVSRKLHIRPVRNSNP